MVQFAASGRFEASATGLLAPSSNIYATADKVTITAGIWVDPNVASNQVFTDWKTAIHQFAFGPQAPAYTGSATVDGAVANQFAFGEVGDRLAVVSTAGTPWMFEPNSRVDMTLFDQAAAPVGTGRLEDLGNGGWVAGVRFTESRAVVSTSNPSDLTQESQLRIIDLTNPDAPVAGATVPTSFSAEYLHPIDATNFIALGSFSEDGPNGPRTVSGVRATLVSTADPAAPNVSTAWTETNAMTSATSDHHEFLWWASAKLAALPLTRWSQDPPQPPPAAAFLGVDGGIDPLGLIVPTEVDVPAPCPVVPESEIAASGAAPMVAGQTVLRCAEAPVSASVDWPGYSCWAPEEDLLKQFGVEADAGRLFVCNDAGPPQVRRIMVIDGATWLNTSESFERVNVQSRASETVIPVG
jgi:hypothetical protein